MSDPISKKIKDLAPAMVTCRRDMHKHAESGCTEFRTASIVAARLTELGYTVTLGMDAMCANEMMGVPPEDELARCRERAVSQGADPALVAKMADGRTGLWADLECSGPGPCFALRFDMDCNDVVESDDPAHPPRALGFASVNAGCMHACGHDGHVAVGLAVAETLAGMRHELKGTIRLIFEPGEEGSRGAGPMVAAGCVRGVDLIAGLHIGFQAAKKGDLVCGAKGFLATTKFDVIFSGRSAHAGAAPQEGKNALLAACAATTNLHAIPRHGDGATRITVGKLQGGQGRNVIPPSAFLAMETRGFTSELDEYMATEARRILNAAAAMWDCGLAIKTVGCTKSGESSPAMMAEVAAIAKSMPAFTNIMDLRDFGASEDFSHMMTEVQKTGGIGTYIQVGTDRKAGHHNDRFDFDEADLVPSAELMVRLVARYLGV